VFDFARIAIDEATQHLVDQEYDRGNGYDQNGPKQRGLQHSVHDSSSPSARARLLFRGKSQSTRENVFRKCCAAVFFLMKAARLR
jgi:hypothetical protein